MIREYFHPPFMFVTIGLHKIKSTKLAKSGPPGLRTPSLIGCLVTFTCLWGRKTLDKAKRLGFY